MEKNAHVHETHALVRYGKVCDRWKELEESPKRRFKNAVLMFEYGIRQGHRFNFKMPGPCVYKASS